MAWDSEPLAETCKAADASASVPFRSQWVAAERIREKDLRLSAVASQARSLGVGRWAGEATALGFESWPDLQADNKVSWTASSAACSSEMSARAKRRKKGSCVASAAAKPSEGGGLDMGLSGETQVPS